MHNTLKLARQYVQDATVFQVATIDAMGFPNLVALTPLTTSRGIDSVLFYTGKETATVRNLTNSCNAAIICFKEKEYSSLMLKGSLRIEPHMVEQVSDALSHFQSRLRYEQPVVLRFRTMSIKFRQHNKIDYQQIARKGVNH
ncbi:pyridoxamine 5'-phosphate oxidase family protein [Bombilactobacillus thymidiniphilus]|uniref:Pyridoxamine 5'-phosphate oxidase family protein n=1 Tax=Bombilactobacillus thymidiniphilus TaxID=2923363 RepID=A0ABY4PF28_9LACO|nr:pyridoxamine 5'-phosphate oxidase family protein [Bombilactobacillus thymidiniphilus]UQS84250.1 pyridoxamine 5'-phosphate oxidase family protein [Bombilactobacillus thymidiniphilus]